MFHVTNRAAVLCKALQHKADMVGAQLHKAAAHDFGGLIVPSNAQHLAIGGAGVNQQIHDLIDGMALVKMLYRDMRWKRNNTYRLEGKSVPRQQLVSFDLDIPFLVENGKALDENPSPTKPLCGEELSAAESSSASPIKRDSGAL